jgi:hypothetical protein
MNNQPTLAEVIHYLEEQMMDVGGYVHAMSKCIGGIADAHEQAKEEKELAKAQHEYDCLSVAITKLKGEL